MEVITGDEVAKRMGEYEDKAIELHKLAKAENSEAILVNFLQTLKPGSTTASSECQPKKTECPAGQVPIGATGQCTDVGPISKE